MTLDSLEAGAQRKMFDLVSNQPGVSLQDCDAMPLQYTTLLYALAHMLFAALTIIPAIIGLQFAKAHIFDFIRLSAATVAFFIIIGMSINVVTTPAFWAILVASAVFLIVFQYSRDRMDEFGYTNPTYSDIPIGWVLDTFVFGMIFASLIYKMVSYFYPHPYGLAGLVASDEVTAGFLHFIFLFIVLIIANYFTSPMILGSRHAQNIWLPFMCSYTIIADISYVINVIAMKFGVDMYMIGYDPISLLSVKSYFTFNEITIFMTIALFFLWFVGVALHSDEDVDKQDEKISRIANWRIMLC